MANSTVTNPTITSAGSPENFQPSDLVRDVLNTPRAKQRLSHIPLAVREDLLGLVLMRREANRLEDAIERQRQRIISKLVNEPVNAALVAELLHDHNRRAAKMRP